MPRAALMEVLVVDDMKAMRGLVRESLHALGCRNVAECADGQEALDWLQHRTPHLILSDLNMPRIDGLGLLKAVREDARLAKTPFIMLTSRGEADLVREAIALKVNNYLVKPFSMNAIRGKIEAVMGPLT